MCCGCVHRPMIPFVEGDCVDRVIKVRQSLREQGYEAEIVLGFLKRPVKGEPIEGHAWIKYKEKDAEEWITLKNY